MILWVVLLCCIGGTLLEMVMKFLGSFLGLSCPCMLSHSRIFLSYGGERGGWCTKVGRGMHGCGLWWSIREEARYFWDWRGQSSKALVCSLEWTLPLKGLYPVLFECSADREVLVSDVLDPQVYGMVRSWNLCFHRLSWLGDGGSVFYSWSYLFPDA